MRAALVAASVVSILIALPALAAPYTDHYGTWAFTGLGPADVGAAAPLDSVLLRLADGSGFTAFVFPGGVRTLQGLGLARPPPLAFECYSDLQSGNLVVRGELTQVAGSCVQTIEVVDGERRFVVRFQGYQVPLRGAGVYCVEAAPANC